MGDQNTINISNVDKDKLIEKLTEELPVLRAKIGISQEELAEIVGISRQTYSAVETRKTQMSWNTFLSLLLFFDNNDRTKEMIDGIGAFPVELRAILNVDRRH